MEKPDLKAAEDLFRSRYLNMYSLDYGSRRYFEASRRAPQDLVARTGPEKALPDAVTCCLVLRFPDREPLLYLAREFRYPAGDFLLSPPAGLLDPEDLKQPEPALAAARREIREETGVELKDGDSLFLVSPLLFSSPGMTDESNAIAAAVVHLEDDSSFTFDGSSDGELFSSRVLINRDRALQLLQAGTEDGKPFSVYTWVVLALFAWGLGL